MNSIDILLVHRDNEEHSVADFLASMREMREASLIREYGFSNWELGRFAEAIRVAVHMGISPPALLSNQLSMARPTRPPYPGSVTASSMDWLTWLEKQQQTLLAWSSLARGYFTHNQEPEAVSYWDSAANRSIRETAQNIARTHGVPTISVALWWVLNQGFPTYAAVGPRSAAEINLLVDSLTLSLSPSEVDRLTEQISAARSGRIGHSRASGEAATPGRQ